MGEAVLSSIVSLGNYTVGCLETSSQRASLLTEKYDGVEFFTELERELFCKYLIISVKPNVFNDLPTDFFKKIKVDVVVSVMAGVKIDKLEAVFEGKDIVRVMPNTPMIYGRGTCGYCLSSKAQLNGAEIENTLKKIFPGVFVKINNENLMNVVTGLSGSGPAYFISIVEAFVEAGIREGLDYKTALELVVGTMHGTAEMIQKSQSSLSELKFSVMSPGGTTAAGISALESNGIRKPIYSAVSKAVKRSVELGEK